jgi:mono/diheme cytochrome c family protein
MRRQTTAAALLFCTASMLVQAQTRTVQDGVYSDGQATRGAALYGERCAACHGQQLQGAQGPPLAGGLFVSHRQGETVETLRTKVRNTMPLDAPGTLTPQQTADVIAYMLKQNGYPSGRTELATVEATTNPVRFPAARPGSAPAPPAIRMYPPVGTVAQLMRGIFFPNSNLIFTVQQQDPGAPPPAPSAQGGAPATMFDWGQGIYKGWQVIDNAAIALADVSPLMLAPGLRCENGKPAPVTEPDWIKFTDQMVAVSKQIYRVAQTRNQEAVSDATGDLADACAACHQVYRDVGPRGLPPGDPRANVNRCVHR